MNIKSINGTQSLKKAMCPFFIIAIFALVISSPTATFACSEDKNCDIGLKCAKGEGQKQGICIEVRPVQTNREEPIRSPLDPINAYGIKCVNDIDCGDIESTCQKSPESRRGVCMQQRR